MNPDQAAIPMGRPIPQKTMFIRGKIIAGRSVHCSAGGAVVAPPLSVRAVCKLANHSGLSWKEKNPVSPTGTRKLIGCVTRKVSRAANKTKTVNASAGMSAFIMLDLLSSGRDALTR